MKQIAMMIALGLALMGVSLPGQAVEGGSIESKLEVLGELNYLGVSDLRAVKRDGLLHIQATISNASPDNERLYYRFRWLDNDGFAVWEEEAWKTEIIYGRQNKVIATTSPTFKATDFRLELQSPNDAFNAPPPGSVADR
jgi:uncharacterized protein YcfL